jgi:hypothetical protein
MKGSSSSVSFPLAEARAAHTYPARDTSFGKVLLDVG